MTLTNMIKHLALSQILTLQ